MADEKPVVIRSSKATKKTQFVGKQTGLVCIVHYAAVKTTDVVKLTENGFEQIQNAISVRQSQTRPEWRLDSIYASVPTVFDPNVYGRHMVVSCIASITRFYWVRLHKCFCA